MAYRRLRPVEIWVVAYSHFRTGLVKSIVGEGDSLYLTDLPGGGYRITPYDPELVEQMKVMDSLMSRYQNTLKALSE